MTSKLITVFGATGNQGSSVLRSLAANTSKAFTLRGITRNPESASAKQLSDSGVEVVKADGWDKDSLLAAFKGSWGVFANTNTDDPVFENPEETRTEFDLGKIIVDAAAEAGVEVFVYSGEASARETTGGKLAVGAFDDKHAIGEYAKNKDAFKNVVIPGSGWYMESFLWPDLAPVFGGFPLIPSDDGVLVFRVPKWGGKEDVPFIGIGDDYGDIVHGIFLEPEKFNGKLVQGVSDIRSFDEVAQAFEKATGKKARYEALPEWNLKQYGVRELETVEGMFALCKESGGRYFGVQTEADTAAKLKAVAVKAKGQAGDEAKLLTLEEFFKREFGGK
ncbi:NAD(P)-binding protein [Sporormia fimetaria CBS 119925]|uniref:NAD(P)-binding protein n=1 Tax=Sporormia fimetaria CBS 119925 TaxID=1340428 RepID=A0A6A6UYM2_9PLEO|nr:NAD(P)-binding protein [Sporormia fimetaria CBS 119925]